MFWSRIQVYLLYSKFAKPISSFGPQFLCLQKRLPILK